MGLNYIRTKNYTDGICTLQFSLSLDEQSANAHDSLAWAYQQSGDIKAAFKHYRKALAIDPSIVGVEKTLESLLAQLNAEP